MQDIFRFDLTEIPGLDNLADPEDVIMLSERLAAEAFGAKKTFFLVNGSTSGIIASIMACVAQFRRKNPTFRGNPKIVLPRSVHKSAIHALVVSGAVPLWIWPDYDEEFHIAYPITPSTLESAMQEHQDIAGVIIVSPSYHGVISDIAGLSRVCDGLDVPLVVDEAHGAHLNAFRARTGISSATVLGADAVVQSTHKCLSSLTQSAMLHVPPNSRLDVSVIQESLPLVQSSSPNYLLMASLDAARWQFSQPEMAGSDLPEISQVAHEKLAAISGLEVFGHPGIGNDQPGKIIPTINPGNSADPILIDPTRITILTRKLGISGFEFAQKLEENGGVYCELASERHVTLALSLGNNLTHIETLVKEASSIAKEARVRANNCDRTTAKDQNRLLEPSKREAASIPPITPREAFLMPTETLSAADAAGQLCAETICPYPPGIPVIVPGELITQDTIERLQRLRNKGACIVGARDATLQTFQVLVANLEQDMA
mmetsp:Transcript_13861/g.22641  ORF Transcript_13861/g.22641 Transcript_13861/m.22641 type:complete len:488 (+) Transcript_13861:3-1466(+)